MFKLALMLMTLTCLSFCIGSSDSPEAGEIGDGRFQSIVEHFVVDSNLPALTVIVSENGETVEFAAVGTSFAANVSLSFVYRF